MDAVPTPGELLHLQNECNLLESELSRLQSANLASSQVSDSSAAVKKKKKRKKKRGLQAGIPCLSSEQSADIWSEELRRLESEYREDVSGGGRDVRVFLTPRTEGRVYCSLELAVKVKDGYPGDKPEFEIGKLVNVGREDQLDMLRGIHSIADEQASIPQESVLEVCHYLIDVLTMLNETESQSRTETISNKYLLPDEVVVRKISGEADGFMIVEDRRTHRKEHFEKKGMRRPETSLTRFHSRFSLEFKDTNKIGEGGGGSVYRAVDRFDEKTYAIKIIKLKHRSPEKISKLTKEVALLSELYHEHIVRYYNTWTEEKPESESSSEEGDDFSSEDSESSSSSSSASFESNSSSIINFQSSSDGIIFSDASSESEKPVHHHSEDMRYLYIKMEYCEGETLRAVLDRDLLLEPSERWRMFREILDALSYMHSRSLVHRDLKPANIFLDSSMRVKIGDFGLATTSKRKAKSHEDSEDDVRLSQSASCGVGTPFYASPEQEAGKVVNEKSDMYSLGVIFFEMWRRFGSSMQRAEEFYKLRGSHSLPPDFISSTPEEVVTVIQQLIKESPDERPKAREMLFSELLPHRFERQLIDDMIGAILNPMTSERKWVLDALFTKQYNPDDVDFSFSIASSRDNNQESTQDEARRLIKMHSLVQSSVLNRFQAVFENGGAINIPAPLINPYYDFLKVSEQLPNGQSVLTVVKSEAMSRGHVVTYMENTGVLVALPSTALVPWSRMISRKNLGGILKRYCFYPTFLPRERQEPCYNLEAAFDICCEERLSLKVKIQMEAETIKVAYDSLVCLAAELPNFDVRINSSKIVDGLMGWVEVPRSIRMDVLHTLCDFHKKKWLVVKASLEKLGLSPDKADKLGTHMRQSGDIKVIHDYLRSKTGKDFSLFRSELQALEQVVEACVTFKIPREKLIVDLSVISDGLLCYSGIMFKFLGRYRVDPPQLAFGGRYDNLIQHYEFPDKEQNMFDSRPVRMSGVGMWIQINQIVEMVLKQHAEARTTPGFLVGTSVMLGSRSGSREEERRLGLEKAAFCAELWKCDISANYFYEEVPFETEKSYCLRYRIPFLIILKLSANNELTGTYCNPWMKAPDYTRELSKTDLIKSVIFEVKSIELKRSSNSE